MNGPVNDRPRLTERDRAILRHIMRYRITTNEVLHRTMFAGMAANSVTKMTRRLCRMQYLRQFPLIHPQTYFVAGERAVRDFGISVHRTRPLGPQSLPVEYAVLAYSTLGKEAHFRLTISEITQRYSWIPPSISEQPHCERRQEKNVVLESIRVDLGGAADHIARKCDSDLQSRVGHPEFYALVADRRFRAVVLTATTDKAAAIEQSLSTHLWPESYAIHLATVPELLQLIPGGFHAR